MLRPEEREDRQLEVVRLATGQVADTVELAVCETEQTMERLFGDGAQGVSLAAAPGGTGAHRDEGSDV
jgi:hypothetical protein